MLAIRSSQHICSVSIVYSCYHFVLWTNVASLFFYETGLSLGGLHENESNITERMIHTPWQTEIKRWAVTKYKYFIIAFLRGFFKSHCTSTMTIIALFLGCPSLEYLFLCQLTYFTSTPCEFLYFLLITFSKQVCFVLFQHPQMMTQMHWVSTFTFTRVSLNICTPE